MLLPPSANPDNKTAADCGIIASASVLLAKPGGGSRMTKDETKPVGTGKLP